MNITRNELYKICRNNKYIAVRWFDGVVTAINCKIANLKCFNNIEKGNQPTYFIGWKPCSFQEYINLKTPFYREANNQKHECN